MVQALFSNRAQSGGGCPGQSTRVEEADGTGRFPILTLRAENFNVLDNPHALPDKNCKLQCGEKEEGRGKEAQRDGEGHPEDGTSSNQMGSGGEDQGW